MKNGKKTCLTGIYIYIHNSDTNMNIMYVHCGYNVYIMCIYDEK